MKDCSTKHLLFLSMLFLFSAFSDVLAVGALYCKPRWSDTEYHKMWIKTVETHTEIQDQIAVTRVNQVFINELNQQAEAVFIFPLPENAMITELIYWFNGNRYKANVRERQEAIDEYNRRLREWLDPALLEYLGDNLFRLKIVPVDPNTEIRTEITYVELLDYDLGKISYQFLLNTLDLSSKPLEKLTVNLSAVTQESFNYFTVPSHEGNPSAMLSRVSDNEYHFFYGNENVTPDKDLLVEFSLHQDDVSFRVLTYTPAPEDSFGTDSFYTLWITPPDSVEKEEILPKDIIFTADVSSSMEGERLGQLKSALQNFLDMLRPEDRFNIVTFSTFVEPFKMDLVPVSEQTILEAKAFVDDLFALGLTNIDAALTASLQHSFRDTSLNNLVFLTDGNPTWGETDPDSILQNSITNNQHDVRVFGFGIGEEISRSLLIRISEQNSGYATFINADDSIALVVQEHFRRQSKPVLSGITIGMGGLSYKDVYPKNFNDLFCGYQLLQMGLYESGGTFDITVHGEMGSEQVVYEKSVTFPDTTGGHRFVPRLWAKAKIDHLLDMIELYGEQEELVDQIVELSLMFEILTPYTAFYSDPNEDDPDTGTSVDEKSGFPSRFRLYPNYPNPFNPVTHIRYDLPGDHPFYHVKVQIFDLLGRLVCTLLDDVRKPGSYAVSWNGRNALGEQVPSGVYVYTIQAGALRKSGKMVLVR